MTLASPALVHIRAVNGRLQGGVKTHPTNPDRLFYVYGGNVISTDKGHTDWQVLCGHDGEITAFAVSTQSDLLASGQMGNADVLLWRADQLTPVFRLEEHDFEVSGLAFSSDDRLLASAGNERDRKLVIWDTSSGKIVTKARFTPKRPTALAWSPMSDAEYTLATAFGTDSTIWRVNPYKGSVEGTAVVTGSVKRSISCFLFSDDGLWLFGGTSSGDILRINVQRNAIQVLHNVCSLGVGSMALLKNGQILVGGGDGTLTFFEKDNMRSQPAAIQLKKFSITSLSPSANGEDMIIGTAEGSILRIPPHLEEQTPTQLVETQQGCITGAVFNPTDPNKFATTSSEGSVVIWDIEKIEERGCGAANCVQVTNNGILSGWSDGHIRSHSQKDGHLMWKLDNAHRMGSKAGVTALTLGKKNDIIISGGISGEIRVWDVATLGIISHMKQHSGCITALKTFSDNSHIASSSKDGSMKVWNFVKETCLTTFTGKMGGINSISLCPDEAQILSVGKDRGITFWDIRSPQPQRILQNAHAGDVTSVGLSKTESIFATGGADKIVRLWDFRSDLPIASLECHTAAITATEYSPNNILISTACDGSIAWWR